MRNKILILFAHPRFERSSNNSILIKKIPDIPEITFHDLYELYPDFNIDLEREKELLTDHNIIVWQHPFYWYSCPPLLKQWIDIVLEFGWAYGPGGKSLSDKTVFNAITAGGQRTAYSRDGHNRFTVKELLAPFDQTAHLCNMTYLPPFVIHGTHRLTRDDVKQLSGQYENLLQRLVYGDLPVEDILKYPYLNDWLSESQNLKSVK